MVFWEEIRRMKKMLMSLGTNGDEWKPLFVLVHVHDMMLHLRALEASKMSSWRCTFSRGSLESPIRWRYIHTVTVCRRPAAAENAMVAAGVVGGAGGQMCSLPRSSCVRGYHNLYYARSWPNDCSIPPCSSVAVCADSMNIGRSPLPTLTSSTNFIITTPFFSLSLYNTHRDRRCRFWSESLWTN
jgi:hypothetical protein